MPDEDQDPSRPNLEPPSLFGRKKRADPEPEPEGDDDLADVPPVSDPTWMFEPPAEDEPEPLPEPSPSRCRPPAAVRPSRLPPLPLFADEVEDDEPAPSRSRREPRSSRQPKRAKGPKHRGRPSPPGSRRPASRPMAGWVAAALAGLVVGLLLVGMTAGSLQACEAVRGTSTCGGYGVPILLVIMAALIAIGGFLLRLFHVPDPGSTSFLAVGMVAVIALLFLLDFLLSVWMLLVIPVIAVAMYLLAYWVTTAFVEPAKEPADLDSR